MKKYLVINAAMVDATEVTDETLSNYENIVVNSAVVITTAETRETLHRHNAALNCANVMDAPVGVAIVSQNGQYTISASDVSDGKPAVLLVNGLLNIEKGAEAAIERYVAIHVNGHAVYPKNMSALLGRMSVNGSVDVYPDDAILLKNNFLLDRAFIVRAKGEKYYAKNRVIVLDSKLDLASLAAKGTTFITGKAIIADSLIDSAVQLFDESAEIITVPDGCAYVKDDAELKPSLIRKHGDSMYIAGSLTVTTKSRELFDKIRFMRVAGTVYCPAALVDELESCDIEYGELVIVKGERIVDKIGLTIDRAMLERNAAGVTVDDCVNVSIAEDVPPELIVERLCINDCVRISCSPEQRTAIEQISTDVVNIDDSGERSDGLAGIFSMFKQLAPDVKSLSDVELINTSSYKF